MDEKARKALLLESDYDPGGLDVLGGGYVSWWHAYIRQEVAACNEYWREKIKRQRSDG